MKKKMETEVGRVLGPIQATKPPGRFAGIVLSLYNCFQCGVL